MTTTKQLDPTTLNVLVALAKDALARDAKATPGPWEVDDDGDIWGRGGSIVVGHAHHEDDANFIVSARTAEPALAQAVLDLIDALTTTRAARDEIAIERDEADAARRLEVARADEAMRLAALQAEKASGAYRAIAEGLERERGLRAQLALVRTPRDDVWHWMGDGNDHPESLSCPVVMSADTLRALVAKTTKLALMLEEAATTIEHAADIINDDIDGECTEAREDAKRYREAAKEARGTQTDGVKKRAEGHYVCERCLRDTDETPSAACSTPHVHTTDVPRVDDVFWDAAKALTAMVAAVRALTPEQLSALPGDIRARVEMVLTAAAQVDGICPCGGQGNEHGCCDDCGKPLACAASHATGYSQ